VDGLAGITRFPTPRVTLGEELGQSRTLAREQAGLGIDETGAKTPFPSCAAARVCPVHMSNMALAQVLHEQRAAVRPPARRDVSSRCTWLVI